MIDNFQTFGFYHIISIIIPIIIGIIFIYLAKKNPDKIKKISIYLAILLILIRSVRYVFDIGIGDFKIVDLFSLHICHINLILLVVCLIKPNRKIFAFNFLVGIPTALSVVLMPGHVHQTPGLLRAIFFIMSHTMLIVGAIYLLFTFKFEIKKKDLIAYYVVAFIGIIAIYFVNLLLHSNFMYLNNPANNFILNSLYKNGIPLYLLSMYIILVILFTVLYFIYKQISKIICK